jgi:hypothetical protein
MLIDRNPVVVLSPRRTLSAHAAQYSGILLAPCAPVVFQNSSVGSDGALHAHRRWSHRSSTRTPGYSFRTISSSRCSLLSIPFGVRHSAMKASSLGPCLSMSNFSGIGTDLNQKTSDSTFRNHMCQSRARDTGLRSSWDCRASRAPVPSGSDERRLRATRQTAWTEFLERTGALRLPTRHLLPQLERLIAAAPVGPDDAESAGVGQAQNAEIM